MPIELGSFDVIIGMDWLRRCHAVIVCDEKLVQIPYGSETLTFCGNESSNGSESRLTVIFTFKSQEYMAQGLTVKKSLSTPEDQNDLFDHFKESCIYSKNRSEYRVSQLRGARKEFQRRHFELGRESSYYEFQDRVYQDWAISQGTYGDPPISSLVVTIVRFFERIFEVAVNDEILLRKEQFRNGEEKGRQENRLPVIMQKLCSAVFNADEENVIAYASR
ncbi:putative reverse transcriptase domain-containing protein [Tanacetum coccineum]